MLKNGSIWVQKNTKYKMAKILQNNLKEIIWYSNTLEYFGWIYSFAKIFIDFSKANLFGYSFVIFLSRQIYSDIHSSNIYVNKYIWIFICQKKNIFVPHCFTYIAHYSKLTRSGNFLIKSLMRNHTIQNGSKVPKLFLNMWLRYLLVVYCSKSKCKGKG